MFGVGFGVDPHVVAVVNHLKGGEELEALLLVYPRWGAGFVYLEHFIILIGELRL